MRTKIPTEKQVRRALRVLKQLRRREWRLGYNLETGYPTRTIYTPINVETIL